jgi:hypothetical protein
MRHLSQRITVTYCIRPLTYQEVKAYINYRLFKSGAKGPLEFQDRAMKLVHTASRGYPRLINCICDRCLLVLYANSSYTVDRRVVSKIIIEESIPLGTEKHTADWKRIPLRLPILIGAIASAVIILGLAGYYLVSTGVFGPTRPKPAAVALAAAHGPAPAAKNAGTQSAAEEQTTITAVQKVSVIKNVANVRERPDIDSDRVGIVPRNEVLTVLGEKTGTDKKTMVQNKTL